LTVSRIQTALLEFGETGFCVFDFLNLLLLVDLTQGADPVPLPDFKTAVLWLRVKIEQNSAGPKRRMNPTQGVHDTLWRQTSQRVREDRHIKEILRNIDMVDICHDEGDLGTEPFRSLFDSLEDLLLVDIKRQNRNRRLRVPPCHTAISAAHLKHSHAPKINKLVDGADLSAIRIDRNAHFFSNQLTAIYKPFSSGLATLAQTDLPTRETGSPPIGAVVLIENSLRRFLWETPSETSPD